MADVSNSEDILDSRDIEERIEELTNEREGLADALKDAESDLDAAKASKSKQKALDAAEDAVTIATEALTEWDNDNAAELKALEAFRDDLEGYCPDWKHGTTLVRDSYWKDYCKELVSDIGDMPRNIPSYIAIDWDQTADNLQTDYTSGEFDGVTYWAR